MRRIWLDTEFSDLIDSLLISVGMCDEEGRQLYVELAEGEEDGWALNGCSEFVRAAVIPLLSPENTYPRAECARRVREFLISAGPDVEVIVDHPIDAALVQELLGDWPVPGLGPVVRWSRVELGGLGQLVQERHLAAGRRHHALDDAAALREGVLAEERAYRARIASGE